MTLTVVSLDPKASAKSEVIRMAKDLLQMAEDGRIVDLSYASSGIDGATYTGITPTEDAHRRLAAVSRLLHRLHCQMDEIVREA